MREHNTKQNELTCWCKPKVIKPCPCRDYPPRPTVLFPSEYCINCGNEKWVEAEEGEQDPDGTFLVIHNEDEMITDDVLAKVTGEANRPTQDYDSAADLADKTGHEVCGCALAQKMEEVDRWKKITERLKVRFDEVTHELIAEKDKVYQLRKRIKREMSVLNTECEWGKGYRDALNIVLDQLNNAPVPCGKRGK